MHPDLDEAMRRSAVVWVTPDGTDRSHPIWHLWHEGAMYAVTGGAEQSLPDCVRAEVVARSKEQPFAQAGSWAAHVALVSPGTPLWDEVVPLLHARRLNAADGESQPLRWAQDCRVLVLTPVD